MRYYQAQDTFNATLDDGSEILVIRGQPLAESHELVKRDIAATRENQSRVPLFQALADDEPPQRPRRGVPPKEVS